MVVSLRLRGLIRVDVGALARRETRFLRCVMPGCPVEYEVAETAPPVKSSVQRFLDSLIQQSRDEVAQPVSSSRYICSRHPRVGSRCVVFDFLGRAEREFYSTKRGRIRTSVIDREARFQQHVSHAVFRVDTSATLRNLLCPIAPPEFHKPTPEELVRLRAANEEYDRRVRIAQERNVALLQDNKDHPIEVFQWRPAAAQTEEWEQKLRVAITQEYEREFRQADVTLHKYISQLLRERNTATRERQIEIDHHVLHMLRTLPFHPAKPRYAREIKLLKDEIRILRGFKTDGDGFEEEADVFEQIVPNYLPTRTKVKISVTLERIRRVWFEDTKTRLTRFSKMKNDPEAVRRSKDFKKLLGATLMLNEDMTSAQAGLLVGESSAAIEKRAQRLREALQSFETA